MVIGERFAWGHLQKTAGDATLGLFGLFPDLIVFADARNTEAKHASFAEREAQIEGKVLAANIRRLPAWTLSWAQQRARDGRRFDDRPVPMNSPEQMVRVPRADVRLAALTDDGRFKVDRWLRMERLAQDFCDFISDFTDLDEEARKRILEFPSVNALSYDHEVGHWFTPERVRRLYENNPLWAEAERQAYGDLTFLD
jgi:hypothetical protein